MVRYWLICYILTDILNYEQATNEEMEEDDHDDDHIQSDT